ncbi:1,4-dihydroxy-2-naphthoate octaprenyltransferase [uncultured Cohaesibacter sp.]|uniref:1,4-dihydroxy-2-naphthoate octaprenyltransferase n=1 Tax=uncultured Cohaesibacter sp. TaxID=1002546 RepID=UPI002A0A580D|nr:1,4-dihydroxy-2-naphthoate octaprenyltransferase [uncultured Cohaesibacter sp.]
MAGTDMNMAERSQNNASLTSVWLMAMRPKTLILSLSPVLLAGLIVFGAQFTADWIVFPIIILSSVCIQIATNLWNDAADASSGLDQASERLGPPRVTSLGLLKPWQVRLAAFLFLSLAALCGLYLVYVGGWPILLIGIVGIICAFGYSSGPYPISGSPFGEVFVICFFGIMSVMGSAYLLTGTWTVESFWAGFYIGLPAAAVLVVNNFRDRVGDAEGGRHTLVIQIGPKASKRLYAILMLFSCVGLVHVNSMMHPGTLSLASLAIAILLMIYALAMPIRQFFLADTAPLQNRCLLGTSMFQLQWMIALIVIMLLS